MAKAICLNYRKLLIGGFALEKFGKLINRILEFSLVFLLALMLIVIFVATVGRFTEIIIIDWAEELARYSMIWIVFIGIIIGAREGEHFAVTALDMFLPKKAMNVIKVIATLFVDGFCFFAAYYGFKILSSQIKGGQVSPSLQWPMWIIYSAVPVGLALMAVAYSIRTYNDLTGKLTEKGGE